METTADWTMEAEETGGKRTTDQVRDKGHRLMGIIHITQEKHCGKEFVQLLSKLIRWLVGESSIVAFAQRVAAQDLGNLAGMATLRKSPRNLRSVYPVFGTIRGANPPVRWSLILVLTLARLSEWRWKNNRSFLCTVALTWQEEKRKKSNRTQTSK